MALLSFVESAPRAYRLKASNAASPISTSSGTIPKLEVRHLQDAFDYLSINDPRMLGANPFRVKSTGDLETIPLNLEEEEFSEQERKKQEKAKKRKGRSLYPK
jgi:alpha-L-fucosidase